MDMSPIVILAVAQFAQFARASVTDSRTGSEDNASAEAAGVQGNDIGEQQLRKSFLKLVFTVVVGMDGGKAVLGAPLFLTDERYTIRTFGSEMVLSLRNR